MAERLRAELDRRCAPDRAAALHCELARLLEHPLGRLEEALTHYRSATEHLPDYLPGFRGVRRCAIRLGRPVEALAPLTREVALTPGTRHKAALLRLRARLLEDSLNDPAAAREAWAQLLTLLPEDVGALRAAARLDRAAADPGGHARDVAALSVAVSGDPHLRSVVLVQRARLAEASGDLSEAIGHYQQALASDREAPGAASALARLLNEAGRWLELVAILEHEIRETDDAYTQTALLLEVARVSEDRLGDTDAAVGALERAAVISPQSAPVLGELARHYTRQRRWSALRDVLERRAHGLNGVSERVAAWTHLGDICANELGDREGAARWFRAALSLDPVDLRALRGLGDLYVTLGRWREAVDVALQEADAAVSSERRAAACARAGALAEQHLADTAFAIAQHERALSFSPGFAPSFAALDRLYGATAHVDAHIALHERAATLAATPAEAIHALFTVATLYETRCAAPQLAVAVYRRILQLAPGRVDALHALQRAAERAGDHQALLAALDEELALFDRGAATVSVSRRVALELRAASLLDEALAAPERAIARYRRALALEPACVAALDGLERLLRRLERWDELVSPLVASLELEPAGAGAVGRLVELARICDAELGDPEAAVSYLERALHHDPHERRVLTALAAALGKAGRHERQVEILGLLVEATEDPAARSFIACRMGEVAEAHLDPREAARAYGYALQAVPGWLPARDALARLARAERRGETSEAAAHAAFVTALRAEREDTRDPAAWRRAALATSHYLLDVVGDRAAGAAVLGALREADPRDVAALFELGGCARLDGDVVALIEVERALAGVVTDRGVAAALLRDVAWLEADHGVGDPVASLFQSLELAPDDPEALLALEELALERGDAALLGEIDARLVGAGEQAGVAGEVWATDRVVRLAESLEALGDSRALLAWMDAVQADPTGLTAAWGLCRCAERDGDLESLAVALQHVAGLVGDDVVAADLLVRLAQVRAAHFDDATGAREALDAALRRAPDHFAAAEQLTALPGRPEEVRAAAAALSRAARVATDPDRVHALWSQVGAWLETPLGDRVAAVAAFELALAARPDDGALLLRVGELCLRDAQTSVAVRYLALAAERPEPAEVHQAARRRLAELFAGELGQPARARELLVGLIDETPDDVAARRLLIDVHRALDDSAGAVAEYRALCERTAGARERAALQQELAELFDEKGDFDSAFAARLEAVGDEGPSGRAAAACREALDDATRGMRYVRALEAWAAAHPDDVGAAYHREVTTVWAGVVGRPEDGLATLAAAVTASPGDLELQETLVDALIAAGAPTEAVEAARGLVLVDPGRGASWRALEAAFLAAGRKDLARRARAGLATTGPAAGEVAARVRRALPVVYGLTPSVLRSLGEEDRGAWAVERLLAALSEYVPTVFEGDLGGVRLERCEQLDAGDGYPLYAEAARVARAFEVEAFELFIAPEPGGWARAFPGARVVVSAGFAAAPSAARCFELARAFALVGRGVEAIEVLDAGVLGELLAAGERLVHPGAPGWSGGRPEVVDDLTRRLARAVPRRARGDIDDCAAATLREGPVDVEAWRLALARTASRAALLACDDLEAALPRLRSEGGAGVVDAIAFWVSDLADRAREEQAAEAVQARSRAR
ncbi:MAG: hypothetical protein CVU56_08625 [Deltaproteobacteria bacterium HGW-Deltaproteobacteria-14]|nr:MAG: hypothetical protein CVU56_08625 [Deltaproteobacteria bacterium HGW-Deltaproteobacteria-14]